MKRWTTLSIKSHTKHEIERIAVEHGMNQCEAVDMLVEEYQRDGRTSESRESWRERLARANEEPDSKYTTAADFDL
jgi:hypothetical protein